MSTDSVVDRMQQLHTLLRLSHACALQPPQGATWMYEAVVSPTLKQVGTEARKVPAVQKALDKLDAFTVRLFERVNSALMIV